MPIASWTSPVVLLAGLAGAALGPGSPPTSIRGGARVSAVAGDTGTLRLHWVIVTDTQMMAHPIEAMRLLAPAGWQSAGAVHWSDRNVCLANLVQMVASARSPDGLTGFEIFTPFSWQWVDDSMSRMIQRRATAASGASSAFCPLAQVMSPADYIRRAILPRFRAGAREIAAEAMPGLAATVQSQLETAYAPLLATHRYTSVHGDAGRVKIAAGHLCRPSHARAHRAGRLAARLGQWRRRVFSKQRSRGGSGTGPGWSLDAVETQGSVARVTLRAPDPLRASLPATLVRATAVVVTRREPP